MRVLCPGGGFTPSGHGSASQIQVLIPADSFSLISTTAKLSQPRDKHLGCLLTKCEIGFFLLLLVFFSVYEIGYRAFPRIISHLDW